MADYTVYCGKSRSGRFKLKRRTSRKKFQAKVSALKDWFRANLTSHTAEVWKTLNAKLAGHYQYYNVNDNWQMCIKYRETARRLGFRWFRRRGNRCKMNWQKYSEYLGRHALVSPGRITDLIAMSRAMGV